MTRDGSAFDVEAASVEEFLRLLTGRERAEAPSQDPCSVARAAVFVAPLQDVTGGRYAFPKVIRRVVVAFAYGHDIVSYRRTTSSAAEVERGIGDANLGVPVHEGRLRHPNDPRQAE